ncbi:MAG: GTP-binding protein EngB [Candidatus Thorarchaeota archaeon]
MSVRNPSGNKQQKPMIVFAGRSNVGKSSTIRALTGKKIRVGKHPGSTRWELTIDMGPVSFVDIPGFGYMTKSNKDSIEEMKRQIVKWLEDWSEYMALGVLIIDISLFRELVDRWSKRGEIPIDIEFYSFLSEISPDVIVVANKMDKLKKREIPDEIDYLRQQLNDAVPDKKPMIVRMSALKRAGIAELKDLVEYLLQNQGIDPPAW